MSTILDALRKVAEERTHGGDVRTRLLSFPSRLDTRARRRPRLVWLVSAALAMIGFSAGAGLMYWRSPVPVQEERTAPVTLARSTSDPMPTAARVPLAVPAVPPSVTTENQAPRRAPDLPQPTPLPVTPLPSPSSAPVLAPPLPVMKDQFAKEPRPVPRSAPAPPREAPPTPAVRPELAGGAPPMIPPMPFTPPMPDTPDFTAPIAMPGAEVAPFPDAAFGTPAVGARFPTQLPPVVDEAATVQSDVSLSLLQWSPDAEKRMAFLRVKGGPLTMAQEGDTVAGLTVTEISPEAVTLQSGDKTWVLQVR